MRIRSIRPEFWSSEDIAAMDWHTRLVFIGLWSYVDDNGVGRDVEPLIVAALFPLDESIPGGLPEASRRVTGALRHLSDHGQITRYKVDGKAYLFVNAWKKHQRIEKASAGRYPLPTSEDAEIREPSPTTPGALPEPSPTGEGEKGRRGEGEKAARTRATQAPDDLQITDAMREWATSKNLTVNLETETERFLDHHRSKGSTFKDWVAAWRTWMSRSGEYGNVRPIRATPSGSSDRAGMIKWALVDATRGLWQECHAEGVYMGCKTQWLPVGERPA